MGQLEKYGLYVLCLVIFLILGVTIWGEPDGVRPDGRNAAAPINASREVGGSTGAPRTPTSADHNRGPAIPVDATLGGDGSNSLASLLQPPADFGKKPVAAPSTPVSTPAEKPSVDKPPVKPEPQPASSTREYKVKKGDTLEGIASRELGSRARVGEIQALNPKLKATSLQIGQAIVLPGAGSIAKTPTPVTGGEVLQRAGAFRDYKVGKGDTLDRIARLELGSSARVDDIKQLNPGLDPRKLQIGQKLKLPIR